MMSAFSTYFSFIIILESLFGQARQNYEMEQSGPHLSSTFSVIFCYIVKLATHIDREHQNGKLNCLPFLIGNLAGCCRQRRVSAISFRPGRFLPALSAEAPATLVCHLHRLALHWLLPGWSHFLHSRYKCEMRTNERENENKWKKKRVPESAQGDARCWANSIEHNSSSISPNWTVVPFALRPPLLPPPPAVSNHNAPNTRFPTHKKHSHAALKNSLLKNVHLIEQDSAH